MGELLGLGAQFIVTASSDPRMVEKYAFLPWLKSNRGLGKKARLRTAADVNCAQTHLNPYVLPTEVIVNNDSWCVRQQRIPKESQRVNQTTATPEILMQLDHLKQLSTAMYHDSGYVLDWLGSAFTRYIPTSSISQWWALPNLSIHNGKIAISDCGLFWTGKAPRPEFSFFFSPQIERVLGLITLVVIKRMSFT